MAKKVQTLPDILTQAEVPVVLNAVQKRLTGGAPHRAGLDRYVIRFLSK